MTSQIVYRSPWWPLPLPDANLNLWDLLRSTLLPDSLRSKEPIHIDLETGRSRTLSEVLDRAELIARYLATQKDHVSTWNLGTPDVDAEVVSVGILSPNDLEFPVIAYACFAAGVVVAPIPSGCQPSEAAYLTRLGQCARVFAHPSQLSIIVQSGYPLEQVILTEPVEGWHGQTLPDIIKLGNQCPKTELNGRHPVPSHQVALILFSSGTTGKPKGVMLTHRNLCASMTAAGVIAEAAATAMAKTGARPAQPPGERVVQLSFLPMYHAYGFMVYILRSLPMGLVQCVMRRWNLSAALEAIPKYRVTSLAIVPTIATQIMSSAHQLEGVDLSSLKSIFTGAAAITSSQRRQLLHLLAARGALDGQADEASMINGYGMSETSVSITTWPLEGYPAGRARPGTIGLLIPGLEARLISESSKDPAGEDVPINTAGEIVLRGPTIMKGYLSNPEATRAAFTSDGWFKTGDKVRIDTDGQMFYIDRLKDTFKNRGKQVAPSEISALILGQYPDLIADAVVVGVPAQGVDSRVGEEAWAFVKLTGAGRKLKNQKQIADMIISLTRQKLSIHKWVVRVEILDEFPQGPSQKVLAIALRDMAITQQARGRSGSKL